MTITRSTSDAFKVTEYTEQVNRIPNQYGFLRSRGYFRTRGTSQTAIIFDKNEREITLLPQVNRRTRESTVGKDREAKIFSLPLAYFKHSEFITPEDIQGHRQSGTPDTPESLENVRLEKMTDGRANIDQTLEYMQIQAANGISSTPDGAVLANMFTEFGVTRPTIDFALGTTTTDVKAKVAELKRGVTANLKTGGTIRGIDVICGVDWFDAFVNHPSVKEAYLNWSSNAAYREDMSIYQNWGVTDVFEFKGVRFMTYPASFTLPDGNTAQAVADDEAFVVPVVDGLFRGYYGPANKLSLANKPGVEMFAFEYDDGKDEALEMQFETAPLFFCTNPGVLYLLTTSGP